ncbi:MAG TPA: hypothetical protein VK550_02375 [Polyangiaceae bacterium]|nr:hypothetical protein [Polyangiaceae bacterium]
MVCKLYQVAWASSQYLNRFLTALLGSAAGGAFGRFRPAQTGFGGETQRSEEWLGGPAWAERAIWGGADLRWPEPSEGHLRTSLLGGRASLVNAARSKA